MSRLPGQQGTFRRAATQRVGAKEVAPRESVDPAEVNPLVAINATAQRNDRQAALTRWLRWNVSPADLRRMGAAAKTAREREE